MKEAADSPILISLPNIDPGYNTDIRFMLGRAIEKFDVLQDKPKQPEYLFETTIESILMSRGVLLDAMVTTQLKMDPDILIQFGICYALGKRIQFVLVRLNRLEQLPKYPPLVQSYLIKFENYQQLEEQLKHKLATWFSDNTLSINRTIQRVVPKEKAFFVMGAQGREKADLYQSIRNFAKGVDWRPIVNSGIDASFQSDSLMRAIAESSFGIFCLGPRDNEDTLITIGLAIGMGIPFLVLQSEGAYLPETLKGYHGVISYGGFKDLEDSLPKFSSVFLSSEVYQWEGSTYFRLLGRIETQLNTAKEEMEFARAEKLLRAIIQSVNPPIAKAYALLGDVYRKRFYKCDSKNLHLLEIAKAFFQQALYIQPNFSSCRDSVDSIDKQIELAELLSTGNYRSIPSLIRIIGENLTSENYSFLRDYLLNIAKDLISQKNYLHALALLAAIQIHDKSDEVTNLIKAVLDSAPDTYLDALLDAQEYAIELQSLTEHLNHEISAKDSELAKWTVENQRLLSENQKLKDELTNILEQLDSVKAMRNKLIQLAEESNSLIDEIEAARQLSGRGVLVNFGFGLGWALYQALYGDQPYLVRDGYRIPAKSGLLLVDDDRLFHSDGTSAVWLIPRDAKIIT